MKEVHGDIWKADDDYVVITTNGAVRRDGAAVMGRGVALQAKLRYQGIEFILGNFLKTYGNHVKLITGLHPIIISFPVKHHWRQKADLKLISQSARELVQLIDLRVRLGYGNPVGNLFPSVALPRPGCGNGQLEWEDVRPIVRTILDNRFTVYNND